MVSKWVLTYFYMVHIGVITNLSTSHFLTSWDIQVAVWVGGLGPGGLGSDQDTPKNPNPFHFGDPRNPNHQWTISWHNFTKGWDRNTSREEKLKGIDRGYLAESD